MIWIQLTALKSISYKVQNSEKQNKTAKLTFMPDIAKFRISITLNTERDVCVNACMHLCKRENECKAIWLKLLVMN